MKIANYDILSFLESIYCPTAQVGNMRKLRNHLREGLYGAPYYKTRLIQREDEGSVRVKVLLIRTKGDSKRKAFEGYELMNADIHKVGNKYAEIYLYPLNDNGFNGTPKRICYDMPTLTILEN